MGTQVDLNALLLGSKIDPRQVLVLRHRPVEPELRRVLPWLAAERPEVFNAYQQTQGVRLERVMTKMVGRGYVASFIGHDSGKALFVGLYFIAAARTLDYEGLAKRQACRELRRFGFTGWPAEGDAITWFDLQITEFYAQWKGKLVVGWPPPERAWWRRADRNQILVLSVSEESSLTAAMPEWHELDLGWEELRALPTHWKAALSQWRGIYFIFDQTDGKGYVGSASGAGNLLTRWLDYAARGHGGNTLLRKRDPRKFRFSILQRVSPDMEASEVVRLESSWKSRLHTHAPLGLNVN